MVRHARAVGLAVACLGACASGAPAATLKIRVPSRVHNNRAYTITISGSYARREVKGDPYLIGAIQFGGQPCEKTAQLENNLLNQPQFYFGASVGALERSSPFTRSDRLRAKATGARHVCAYLYPQFSGPTDDTEPIATADASYRVYRRR